MGRLYDGSMVRWLDGDNNKEKTRTRMTMMTLFFEIRTNLVVGCIPVREGRGVFSTMIRKKTVRTRMSTNYNDNNEQQQQTMITNYNDQQGPTTTTTTTNNNNDQQQR